MRKWYTSVDVKAVHELGYHDSCRECFGLEARSRGSGAKPAPVHVLPSLNLEALKLRPTDFKRDLGRLASSDQKSDPAQCEKHSTYNNTVQSD